MDELSVHLADVAEQNVFLSLPPSLSHSLSPFFSLSFFLSDPVVNISFMSISRDEIC